MIFSQQKPIKKIQVYIYNGFNLTDSFLRSKMSTFSSLLFGIIFYCFCWDQNMMSSCTTGRISYPRHATRLLFKGKWLYWHSRGCKAWYISPLFCQILQTVQGKWQTVCWRQWTVQRIQWMVCWIPHMLFWIPRTITKVSCPNFNLCPTVGICSIQKQKIHRGNWPNSPQ